MFDCNFRENNITNKNENIVWSKHTYSHVRGYIQIMIDDLKEGITTSFDQTKFKRGRIGDLEKFYQVVKREIQ